MSILNKRNAVFGWAVWEAGKRVMSAKAKRAVKVKNGGRGGRIKAVVAGVGAAAGAAWLARRLSGGGNGSSGE
jgi:hypothetical protein